MKYGLMSGILWAIDTVILGVALSMGIYATNVHAALVSATFHDVFAALILLVYMSARGRLAQTVGAIKTPNGKMVMLGALLGGPIGMSGYLAAIEHIGAGYTAAISAFYPAVGAFLAVVILKEKMKPKQVVMLLVALFAIVFMGWLTTSFDTSGNPLIGIACASLCVVGWGSEAVLLAWGMKGTDVDPDIALQIRETTSALTYALIVVPLTGSMASCIRIAFTPENGVVALAALAGVASYLAYYKAINCIGAARGMALNISYAAWAVLISALVMRAVPSPWALLCCVLIIVGTTFSASPDWSELDFTKPHHSTNSGEQQRLL